MAGSMNAVLVLIFELIGTVSFAVSGAITALRCKMDVFGVVILGVTTAVGGGVIRDVILGVNPPTMFSAPIYALVAIIVSLIVFIPWVHGLFIKNSKVTDIILLIMDSIGLGVFTVAGIQAAMKLGTFGGENDDMNVFLLLFVGVVTGVGGGVLRDVLAGNTPYIFVKHFYACASLIGAGCTVALWYFFGETPAVIAGAAVVVILRFLAARFRWSLPKSDL